MSTNPQPHSGSSEPNEETTRIPEHGDTVRFDAVAGEGATAAPTSAASPEPIAAPSPSPDYVAASSASGSTAGAPPRPSFSAASASSAGPRTEPWPNPAVRAPARLRPRTGPIVWGTLFLMFVAFVAQRVFFPGYIPPVAWVTLTVIGIGVMLLVVGVVIVLRNGRDRANGRPYDT